VTPPAAYLEPHSSADGIAFWRGDLYVALWGQYLSTRHGRTVMRVRLGANGKATRVTELAHGFDHPLALLVDRGALLVADWGTGIVYRLQPSGG
jgi:glucose/arabinose dehydrogenase